MFTLRDTQRFKFSRGNSNTIQIHACVCEFYIYIFTACKNLALSARIFVNIRSSERIDRIDLN